MAKRGARAWGVSVGSLPTGPHNRLTDVLGVRVGHRTVREQGVRTGVTVVLPHRGNPFREKVAAGVHVANGYTKAAGLEQVRELGTLESPVAITNTLAVGRVLAGLVGLLCDLDPGIGSDTDGAVNAVVLECNDGWLNDIRRPAVAERHLADAVDDDGSAPDDDGPPGDPLRELHLRTGFQGHGDLEATAVLAGAIDAGGAHHRALDHRARARGRRDHLRTSCARKSDGRFAG